MRTRYPLHLPAALALSTAILALPLSALAAGNDSTSSGAADSSTAGTGRTPSGLNTSGSSSGRQATGEEKATTADAGKVDQETMRDANEQVTNAADVVKRMQADPGIRSMMSEAKGLFIVPQYARGGLGVAARGGEGVLMANNGGKWSSPVFYNYGGVSIGAQAGVETGSMAMLLMNDKAMNNFMQDNKFSLTADAGLTIVNYTAKAKAQAGRGDVVVWMDTEGAFADASVGVTDISFDEEDNKAWYKQDIAASDIISGKVTSGSSNPLEKQLSGK